VHVGAADAGGFDGDLEFAVEGVGDVAGFLGRVRLGIVWWNWIKMNGNKCEAENDEY
jgi:hypothetical protein